MKNIRTSIKNNQKLLKWLLFFILFGILIGFILYEKTGDTTTRELSNITAYLKDNHINYIVLHLFILSLIIMGSLTIIGIVIIPIYLVFEISCITYSILAFVSIYNFSGFIYGFLYNIITKLVFIILLLCLFKKLITIIKILINLYLNKEITEEYNIKNYLKKISIFILTIFLNDIFIYLWASKILLKLAFIL